MAQVTEYEVKAAYLLNFARFVEWPPAKPDAPVVLCVTGMDPFGRVLDDTVRNESVAGRPIQVSRVPRPQDGCHVLFFGGESLPTSGASRGALTVGEGESFLAQGGMIAFVLDGRRVRFDVNLRAAVDAGVSLSSRLLKVARKVRQ